MFAENAETSAMKMMIMRACRRLKYPPSQGWRQKRCCSLPRCPSGSRAARRDDRADVEHENAGDDRAGSFTMAAEIPARPRRRHGSPGRRRT